MARDKSPNDENWYVNCCEESVNETKGEVFIGTNKLSRAGLTSKPACPHVELVECAHHAKSTAGAIGLREIAFTHALCYMAVWDSASCSVPQRA